MRTPNGILEALIICLMLIPIGLWYLLKWLVKGIIFLIVAFTTPSKEERMQNSGQKRKSDNRICGG